jgi:hypothetical protein
MSIEKVVSVLNRMRSDGIIERYAVGGAVAATFYLEPFSTVDINVFVPFRIESGSWVANPEPLFNCLRDKGFGMDGEYVSIGGWPVQLLPATDGLVEEALLEAINHEVKAEIASVFSMEHLAAIALATGRSKDRARLSQFIESAKFDPGRFQAIVVRHQLLPAWTKFQKQFLVGEQ